MRHSFHMQRVFAITEALYDSLYDRLTGAELTFPRDIERLILYGLEVPVVRKRNLTLHIATQYLCALRGESPKVSSNIADRELYGLLHVGPPCNIIFIREDLPDHIRNYVLAHELGHFLADVFLIQQLWLKTLPEQKGTIERIFSWQEDDVFLEFCGLIKGLPSRPKAIIGRGNALAPETTEREIQADLVARELLAPWNTVSALFQPHKYREFIMLLREQFGLPPKIAAYYYLDLERFLVPKPDMLERLFAPFFPPAAPPSSKK